MGKRGIVLGTEKYWRHVSEQERGARNWMETGIGNQEGKLHDIRLQSLHLLNHGKGGNRSSPRSQGYIQAVDKQEVLR